MLDEPGEGAPQSAQTLTIAIIAHFLVTLAKLLIFRNKDMSELSYFGMVMKDRPPNQSISSENRPCAQLDGSDAILQARFAGAR